MKCLLNKFSGIDPVNFRVHLFNYFLKMEVFCAYRALDLWRRERGEPRRERRLSSAPAEFMETLRGDRAYEPFLCFQRDSGLLDPGLFPEH